MRVDCWYAWDKRGVWNKMVVLFAAKRSKGDSESSGEMEKKLIAACRSVSGAQCLNRIGAGGEGASDGSPHFVYCVYQQWGDTKNCTSSATYGFTHSISNVSNFGYTHMCVEIHVSEEFGVYTKKMQSFWACHVRCKISFCDFLPVWHCLRSAPHFLFKCVDIVPFCCCAHCLRWQVTDK